MSLNVGAHRTSPLSKTELEASSPVQDRGPVRDLETPLAPRVADAGVVSATHGGHGLLSTIASLRGSTAMVEPAGAAAPVSPPTRADRLADPSVQAALSRVPGMKALRLEELSVKAIALGALTATETAQLIKDKQISVVEVVQASIDRAKAGAHLGAIDHPLFDRAIAQAKAMDAKGEFEAPFAGVPMAIKANSKLAGAPASYGSRAVPDTPVEANSPHIDDVLALGVIPVIMSTTSEFGFNGVTEPEGGAPARNPHDPAHTAGGSSGGSAVAVASGIVPFAHGTDGGGSCRIPASLCGVLGIKPTRRRLSLLDGAEKLPVLINTPGILARSASDLSESMQHLDRGAVAGMSKIGKIDEGPDRPLKIAYYVDPVGRQTSPEVREATEKTVERLRAMGHTVEEIAPPYSEGFEKDFLDVYRLIAWGVRRNLKKNPNTDHTKMETFSQGLAGLNLLKVGLTKVFSSARLKGQHTKRYDETFDNYDLLLNPTVSDVAPKIGHLSPAQTYEKMIDKLMDLVSFTPLQNATGGPAISIPAGASEAGLPIGMQFAAKSGADALLLRMAHALSDEAGARATAG